MLDSSNETLIRHRNSSSLDLGDLTYENSNNDKGNMKQRHIHLGNEKNSRRRLVFLLLSSFLLLVIVFYVFTAPPPASTQSSSGSSVADIVATSTNDGPAFTIKDERTISLPSRQKETRYAVVFDAGSSGSRVHVYSFDDKFELVPIGDDMELFRQKKPGLSSYAANPEEAVDSLRSLLDDAINVVPVEKRSETPVRLGATAGLRALPGDSAKNILNAVTAFFTSSPFKFQPDWVSILDGTQEGAFEWVTINYLLGNIGKDYGSTVGVVDLGGGSVQMAYAISDEHAKNAPEPVEGEDVYVKDLTLLGKAYYLYVHSYLHYGLLAARAEVLKLVKDNEECPCLAKGFEGEYVYGSVNYRAVGSASGADYDECQELVVKALKKDHACDHMQCTFGGVWNGGGGDGQKKLLVASFFFDRALQAGIIDDPEAVEAKLKAEDFEAFGRKACSLSIDGIGEQHPSVDQNDRPYFCLDLVYEYTLLVEGFGINKHQDITLIKKVAYKDSYVEAAWPLGSAIEVLSSSS